MPNLFPSATPKMLRARSRKCAKERLADVQKTLATIPKLPHLDNLEVVKKELREIQVLIEILQNKIG